MDLNVELKKKKTTTTKEKRSEQPRFACRGTLPNVLYAKEEGEEGEETETKKTTVSSESISWWCSFDAGRYGK